jgi:hypothetical protein
VSPLPTNKRGDNVLHVLALDIATVRLRELFRDLVRYGVDINARNTLGETPLFSFAFRELQNDFQRIFVEGFKREHRGKEYEQPTE